MTEPMTKRRMPLRQSRYDHTMIVRISRHRPRAIATRTRPQEQNRGVEFPWRSACMHLQRLHEHSANVMPVRVARNRRDGCNPLRINGVREPERTAKMLGRMIDLVLSSGPRRLLPACLRAYRFRREYGGTMRAGSHSGGFVACRPLSRICSSKSIRRSMRCVQGVTSRSALIRHSMSASSRGILYTIWRCTLSWIVARRAMGSAQAT
jgi:hypothetical protein